MPVIIQIRTLDNLDDLNSVEIKRELVEHFGLKECEVKVSKITKRQYDVVTKGSQ